MKVHRQEMIYCENIQKGWHDDIYIYIPKPANVRFQISNTFYHNYWWV